MRLICLILVLLLVLTGCGTGQELEQLQGAWRMEAQADEELVTNILETLDLYPEEIGLVDMDALHYVVEVRFDQENYSFDYVSDESRAMMGSFLDGVMADLYEGRTALNDVYGLDFTDATQEQFRQFYAELYGYEDDAAMLAAFTDGVFFFEGNLESGTFKVRPGYLACTASGETETKSLFYKLEGDTLTLTYSDAVEVYTKVS